MFLSCKSYADQAACLKNLVDVCFAIEAELNLPDYDVRRVAVCNVANITRSAMLTLNLLENWRSGDEIVRGLIPQILGLENVSVESVEQAGGLIKKTSKLSFCLLSQFQIENCIAALLKALAGTEKKSFYENVSDLVKILKMNQKDLQTLDVSAKIRNSLHRNGMHRAVSKKEPKVWQFKIEPVEYFFEDNKHVHCADYEHIAHALEASVNVLKKIFAHPDVIKFKSIPDEYADFCIKQTPPLRAGKASRSD